MPSQLSGLKLLLRIFSWVVLMNELTDSVHISFSNETKGDLDSNAEVSIVQQHSQPNCWVFTHLQKSGGSSVKNILANECDFCSMQIYDVPRWCSGTPGFQGEKMNVIAGGYTEALRFNPEYNNCAWFTLFRHPIPRLTSAFFYCKKHRSDKCCGSSKMPAEAQHNITAFAKHWGNFAVRQFALGLVTSSDVLSYFRGTKGTEYNCRKDSGWYWMKLYLEETSTYPASITHEEGALYGMLQRIKDLLNEKFTAVGILEEFNTTMSLFDAALQVPGLGWREKFLEDGVKNADHKYEDEEKKLLAESWTNSELKDYIYLDILLYQHAVDVFHQQAQFYGVN